MELPCWGPGGGRRVENGGQRHGLVLLTPRSGSIDASVAVLGWLCLGVGACRVGMQPRPLVPGRVKARGPWARSEVEALQCPVAGQGRYSFRWFACLARSPKSGKISTPRSLSAPLPCHSYSCSHWGLPYILLSLSLFLTFSVSLLCLFSLVLRSSLRCPPCCPAADR